MWVENTISCLTQKILESYWLHRIGRIYNICIENNFDCIRRVFSTFVSSQGSFKYDVRTRGSQVQNSEKRRDANGGVQGTNSEKVNVFLEESFHGAFFLTFFVWITFFICSISALFSVSKRLIAYLQSLYCTDLLPFFTMQCLRTAAIRKEF